MSRCASVVLVALMLAFAEGFGSSAFCSSCRRQAVSSSRQRSSNCLRMAVVDINSEAAFDKTINSAGSALVIVDYSTTWCGPCKVIAPKFDQLSEKYPEAVFLKVIGDATPEASKLMKREGVRSVPSFHYFLNGEKIDVVNGANAEAIEGAITKHLHAKA